MPDDIWENLPDIFITTSDHMVFSIEEICHFELIMTLVIFRIGKGDRKCLEGIIGVFSDKRGDDG